MADTGEGMKAGDKDVTRRGSCLCGAVTFRTEGPVRGVVYCHCRQCRKQTGHYLGATSVSDAAVTIEGGENLVWYKSSSEARRGFCGKCGSGLFWKRDGADVISIVSGAFDDPSHLAGDSHIFVADKGDYYEITDGLPQFPAARG